MLTTEFGCVSHVEHEGTATSRVNKSPFLSKFFELNVFGLWDMF
jgi:hypothetical protein